MKNIFIKKTIATALVSLTLFGVLPMAASAAIKTGWTQDNSGKWYYYDNNGVMLKNTTTKEGYVLGADGAWIKGNNSAATSASNANDTEGIWKMENSKWYFYDRSGVRLKNTTVIDKGNYYRLGADGAMVDGQGNPSSDSANGLWLLNGGKWYFKSNTDNSYVKGWLKDGGQWFYLDEQGVAQINTTLRIDNKDYKFSESGACTNK